MNAEQLTLAFERGGDAPEHVQRLRKLVVASAITGRIEKSGHFEGPSSILNAAELTKEKLFKAKEIPKPKVFPAITDEDLPTDFNPSLVYAPLGQIARVEKGLTGIKDAKPGAYPLVVTAAERGTCDHHDFTGPAAIVPLVSSTGHGNASINRLHYQEGEFALGTILAAILPYDPQIMSARFLFEYLTAFKEELLVSRMTGSANVTLTIGRLSSVPVPVVCPSIQQKVQELMALLDGLEAARGRAEGARDKLTAATLHRLTDPDTDTQAATAFALQTLPALTTRPDQIKPLRQTILNLAVRGKLVEQDPADEPAAVLLEQLRADRGKLLKEKGVRAKKPVDPLRDIDDLDLPCNWTADAFANLIDPRETISYGVLVPGPDEEGGVPFVRAQDLALFGHPSRPNKTISLDIERKYARTRLRGGEILLCVVGSIGKLGVVPPEWAGANIARAVARISPMEHLSRDFVLLFLRSDLAQSYFEDATRTLAQPTLNVGLIEKLPFPLPPLAEQHRIVAKVDALMALCDQLETALTTATTTRSRLLDTFIRSALSPDVPMPEAAE